MSLEKIEQINGSSKSAINKRDKDLLNKFNLLLEENLYNSRSVKYYANLLAISTKKLNSITKTNWDKTAKEFIEEKIIQESKKTLLHTEDTVKQISYIMGFTEPTNFNKFFKKLTATTPLQFRQKYNKGAF
jgi:AraC family transcriptional regulator, transcriptional activator of pobA